MFTIACAMIVRDAEKTLGTTLASIVPYVDEVVVVDTGSVDGTRAVAESFGVSLYHLDWPDHFAQARQFAHDQCVSEWVLFLDADDEVVGAEHLRALVEHAPDDMDAYMLKYVLCENPTKAPEQEFWRERLTRRGTFHWEGRVHEVLIPNGAVRYENSDVCYVRHLGHGDGAGSLARNIRLLRMELEEQPGNVRALFYLGRDLVHTGDLEAGIAMLEDYVLVSQWPDELFTALSTIGHALRLQTKYTQAYESDLRMLTVQPMWPQAWYFLCQDCYFLKQWQWCAHYANIGRQLAPPVTALFQAPKELESGWMIFVTIALWNMGQVQEALDLTKRALELRPDDIQHMINKAFFESKLTPELPEVASVSSA